MLFCTLESRDSYSIFLALFITENGNVRIRLSNMFLTSTKLRYLIEMRDKVDDLHYSDILFYKLFSEA